MNLEMQAEDAWEMASWWRLVELCMPESGRVGEGMFAPEPDKDLDMQWETWLREVFEVLVKGQMVTQRDAVAMGDFSTMLRKDAELGAVLTGEAGKRSLAAGRRILECCGIPRGARSLEKLSRAASASEDVGHLATVFAVRGEIFHLPVVQLTGAMLLAECVLGTKRIGRTLPMGQIAGMLRRAMGGIVSPEWEKLAV